MERRGTLSSTGSGDDEAVSHVVQGGSGALSRQADTSSNAVTDGSIAGLTLEMTETEDSKVDKGETVESGVTDVR